MFVMIPCLKSACILFDLSLQHSHFFIQQNNPTYCMLFPNNLNIHTFSCHQKFIKEIWPKLTLQYIFLKYWRFKTAIAESNSDFDKSPDFIRLHAHSINFQNQLLYQVFSFFTEINFHKKIIWTSSTYKKNLLIVTIQRKSEKHEHMSLIFSLISMNGCYKKNSKLNISGPNVAYNHPNPF